MKKLILFLFVFIILGANGQEKPLFNQSEINVSNYPNISITGRLNWEVIDNNGFISNKYQLKLSNLNSEINIESFENISIQDSLTIHLLYNLKSIKKDVISELNDFFKQKKTQYSPCKIIWYFDGEIPDEYVNDTIDRFIEYESSIPIFSNLLISLKPKQNHIILQINKDDKNVLIEESINLIRKHPENARILLSYIYLKKKAKDGIVDENDELINKYLLFHTYYKKKNFKNELDYFFSRYFDSFYKTTFKLIYNIENSKTDVLDLNLVINSNAYSNKYNVEYPTKKFNSYFVNATIKKVSDLIEDSLFQEAIDTLSLAKKNDIRSSFDSIASILVKKMSGEYIDGETDPSDFFHIAEKWKVDEFDSEWYYQTKIQILSSRLFYKQNQKADISELIEINNQRLQLDSTNLKYKLIDLKLHADYKIENNKEEESLKYLNSYIQLQKDKDVLNDFQKNLRISMVRFFKNKDYYNVYSLGQSYFSYIKSNFELRYYFAFSSYKLKDYKASLDNYNWMLSNWSKNQNIVSWEGIHSNMDELYMQSFNFKKALELNRRFYRQNPSADLLADYLTNLRLLFIKPVGDAVYLYSKGVNSNNVIKLYNKDIINVPHFVSNIYVMNGSNVIEQFNKNSKNPPDINTLQSIIDFPVIEKRNSTSWLINQIGYNDFYIIELNDSINITEANYLEVISKKKDMAEPWKDLIVYETNILQSFLSIYITNTIGKDILTGNRNILAKYDELVNKNSLIEYLVFYDVDGDVIYSINFNENSGNFNKTELNESKTTNAIYKQEINYNNKSITDISNPFFIKGIRKCVIRIGINQL